MILNQETGPNRTRLFWVLFVLTLLTLAGMQITGAPLVNQTAPAGIVSFELVGDLVGSQAIMNSWTGETLTWAGINMGLDFLFLTLYGITIALGCLLQANQASNPMVRKLGVWLAVGVLFASVLDIIENVSLVLLLTGSENAVLPQLARAVAIPKFALVFLALAYVFLTAVMLKLQGLRPVKSTHPE